jgi:hypothetical protein
MPITILYYLGVAVILLLLVLNIVLPLLNPRYRLCWIFRKDPYIEAREKLDKAYLEEDLAAIRKESSSHEKDLNKREENEK